MIASSEEKQRRQKICNACPNNKGLRCGYCGCFLYALQTLTIAECKMGKFSEKVTNE